MAVQRGAGPVVVVAQGAVAGGGPLTAATRVYTASLSKQFTAACAALLVRQGRLDIETPLARWLPELPSWASAIRLRHLVHHIAGLPADEHIDATLGDDEDRTTAAVITALRRVSSPHRPPGTAFAYSNAGYVCLGLAIQRAAGQPLADLARHHLFDPLGMHDTLFWPGPEPMPPASTPLACPHPAPLSLGDGGVWSTANDLLRWGQAMNTDVLGISTSLHTPGRLDDGRPLDYAWGIGVRRHAGHPTYRHGGGWPGLRLLLARVPNLDIGLVIIAPTDDTERRVPLADALLTELTSPSPGFDTASLKPQS
ncbi:serine hydrolase domain-containing protein [Micromonospora sp. NPDC049891]|uniref:serine hydrolase domain-containing protein n=1 Tax=Micromonospora sp. NPDC049891 TaxID=3155655 RepID=UPI0033C6290B